MARLLRYARLQAGLSQQQLAQRCGVAQPTIARIETGRISPRVDTVERLLSACGFALDLVPRSGIDVDRSAIRQLLALKPAERARLAVKEARNLDRLPPTRLP
jgi:transcriptional regulator with XRE-family HTH domain